MPSPRARLAGLHAGGRLGFAARYLLVLAVLNLAWELAQLPLYTIWRTAPLRESVFAAVHCTIGDLVIAAFALGAAVLVAGRDWPQRHYLRVAAVALVLGLAYTLFSEWLNIEVRRTWAYAPAMPRLPWLGAGLTPVLQWLLLPSAAFVWLRPAR